MIADCDNEETMLMWSTANELLSIPNNDSTKARRNEFQRRFNELKKFYNSTSQNSTSTDSNGEISLKQKSKSSKVISYALIVISLNITRYLEYFVYVNNLWRTCYYWINSSIVASFVCRDDAYCWRNLSANTLHQ